MVRGTHEYESLDAIPSALLDAGWRVDGNAILREYRFRNFRDAIAFIARAAFDAEALDHHPEWANTYRRVTIRLTTHATGGLTTRDTNLAARFEAIAARLLSK